MLLKRFVDFKGKLCDCNVCRLLLSQFDVASWTNTEKAQLRVRGRQ